jgi:hypothetical protein
MLIEVAHGRQNVKHKVELHSATEFYNIIARKSLQGVEIACFLVSRVYISVVSGYRQLRLTCRNTGHQVTRRACAAFPHPSISQEHCHVYATRNQKAGQIQPCCCMFRNSIIAHNRFVRCWNKNFKKFNFFIVRCVITVTLLESK